jgi:hypothetical protein
MVDSLRAQGATREAAALLRKAIAALEQAAERAGGQRFLADLLNLSE